MKATIKDVAKLAGVSFKTVSRVINNEPTVGKNLQQKVWDAVKTLNYQPNLSARQLRGRPSSIGLVYDNPNSHYIIDVQNGILSECHRSGYELLIHPCHYQPKTIVDELEAMVQRSRVAGLILTPPISESASLVKALIERQIYFVRILSGSKEPDNLSPCVYVDDRNAAVDITQYLIDLGHQKISFLCGDRTHKSNSERLIGYKEALKKNGLTVHPDLILSGRFSFESGFERASALLKMADGPTAVFAANDEIAAGVLFASRLQGVSVPQDLSIVGFEDSPFSRQTWPKLTTAMQPTEGIANRAASLLIDLLEPARVKEDKPQKERGFYPKLVVRDSTGSWP